jgi:hypothetical protein
MVRIREIINQNPWWKHGHQFFVYDRHFKMAKEAPFFIKRNVIRTEIDNIYLIRGCRQVGKTTLIKDWIHRLLSDIAPEKILYLSVDFFTSRRELRNAINYFIEQNVQTDKIYIFLDEITYLEDWNIELKYLWDSGISSHSIIVVTGSSGYNLRKKAEQLPGRGVEGNEYYVKPLNFRQFCECTLPKSIEFNKGEFSKSLEHVKDILSHYCIDDGFNDENFYSKVSNLIPFKKEIGYLFNNYLQTGGFPFVINSRLNTIMKTEAEEADIDYKITETFIKSISGEINKRGLNDVIFKGIMREIISKYGSRYSFSKLANDVDTTHVTLINYVDFLENSFILSTLYAYNPDNNTIKEKGQKKITYQDPFLYAAMKNYISGISVNNIYQEIFENENLKSLLVEGAVHSHLIQNVEKPNILEGKNNIFFYYDTRGKEIDYIIRKKDELIGIDVKYREKVSSKDINKISGVDKYYILSKEDVEYKDNIIVIPIDLFLIMLKRSPYIL